VQRDSTPFDLYTSIPGFEHYATNSFHHQAVKDLAPGFEILGWSPVFTKCDSLYASKKPIVKDFYKRSTDKSKKNGFDIKRDRYAHIEIIRHVDRPYLGIQYHPEEFNCNLAIKLISDVLEVEPVLTPVI